MPDQNEPTPEELAAADLLARVKQRTRDAIISHMNGIGANIIAQYPMIEEKSWPIQNPESAAVIALGRDAVLAMSEPQLRGVANFLVDVCVAHYGPAEADANLAAQLWAKASAVRANAVPWASMTAYVNGLRARMDDRIAAATTPAEVLSIESEIHAELGAFRNEHGV
ncbi:MAG: hypothetical protein P0Y65_20735 [Candidatus Devosia phytovorans]|uniref:Uncharacterized protein n=1 Tax=Candidatus Devosia phytovorans TaxID=3121372 RepID=A0AAJ6B0S7_9HYPH|nr:hypothetical protein [Devosia sp.]WEK04569.1 MAG: hypothetical protein P0Y65_20735 [Devosia sp.]